MCGAAANSRAVKFSDRCVPPFTFRCADDPERHDIHASILLSLLRLLAARFIAVAFAGLSLPMVRGIPLVFAGIVVGEFSRHSTVRSVLHAGVGATLGRPFGALLKIALAFTMVGIFVLDRLL